MQLLSQWLGHTPMTEPAALKDQLKNFPSNVAFLNRIVQGLLVHSEWRAAYGIDPNALTSVSRATLPVSERLGSLITRDALNLDEARAPARREVGTCRDFALTLCSFLRAIGTPARLRCGFASYFGEGWEDHWVCEYWDSERGAWLLSDAQLDEVIRVACGVTFNTSDVPRDVFLSAGEAWLRCRTGRDHPANFGQGSTRGLWFIMVNVIRDSYAVNNREISVWDGWREALPELRTVSPGELSALDRLAREPEVNPGELIPPWLSSVLSASQNLSNSSVKNAVRNF
jgi:hypothetical protein